MLNATSGTCRPACNFSTLLGTPAHEIFVSACWCCHQCSAHILIICVAISASFTSLRYPGRRSSLSDKFITHSGVQNRLRMFELLDLLQVSYSLHFKLVHVRCITVQDWYHSPGLVYPRRHSRWTVLPARHNCQIR